MLLYPSVPFRKMWLFATCTTTLMALSHCSAPATHAPPAHASSATTHKPAPQKGESKAPKTLQDYLNAHPAANAVYALVSQARGLELKRDVGFDYWSRAQVTNYIKQELKREHIDKDRVRYQALGLLADDVDIEHLLVNLLSEQIVGFYDPRQKQMVLRSELKNAGQNAVLMITLAHELVHALQDQHFGIDVEHKANADEENAYRALIEGDATFTTMVMTSLRAPSRLNDMVNKPDELRSILKNQGMNDDSIRKAPDIVRVPLIYAYFDGLVYCAAQFREERSFNKLNQVYARTPTTSEQILHPERHLRHETSTSLSQLDPQLDARYILADVNTLGELEMRIFLQQGLDEHQAESAADGWDGDRVWTYRTDAKLGFMWLWLFDNDHEAQEAEISLKHYAKPGQHAFKPVWRRKGRFIVLAHNIEPADFSRGYTNLLAQLKPLLSRLPVQTH